MKICVEINDSSVEMDSESEHAQVIDFSQHDSPETEKWNIISVNHIEEDDDDDESMVSFFIISNLGIISKRN